LPTAAPAKDYRLTTALGATSRRKKTLATTATAINQSAELDDHAPFHPAPQVRYIAFSGEFCFALLPLEGVYNRFGSAFSGRAGFFELSDEFVSIECNGCHTKSSSLRFDKRRGGATRLPAASSFRPFGWADGQKARNKACPLFFYRFYKPQ
jgi:hypothetical protein